MFWPPPGQEWFIPVDNQSGHNDNHHVASLATATIEDTCFDTEYMLPYLSPSSLFAEEEEAVQRRMASNWGGYHETSTSHESLKQWQAGDINVGPESTTLVATTSREALTAPPYNSINPVQSNMSSIKP